MNCLPPDAPVHLAACKPVEAELLGICLRFPDVIDEVAVALSGDDFYADAHRRVWRTLLDLTNDAEPVTLVSVADQLHRDGALEDVGGHAALADLWSKAATEAPALALAKRVRDYSVLRQLHRACQDGAAAAARPAASAEDTLAAVEKRILGIGETSLAGEDHDLDKAMSETMEVVGLRFDGKAPEGISTGLASLDRIVGGLRQKELIIVGARPSVGKTSFGLHLARSAAVEAKVPTLFVSLEQSRQELCERMLATVSGVRGGLVRSGRIREVVESLSDAALALRKVPLWINDASAQSMTSIAASVRRLRRRHGLGLVVVDYLQLVEPDDRKDPRHLQVARVCKRLKQLARDLQIPVVALAQLNREVEGRGSREPRLSDLRESGQLEQDGDVVLLLHRPEEDEGQEDDRIEVDVAKHRNGQTGRVVLEYQRHLYQFADVLNEPAFH